MKDGDLEVIHDPSVVVVLEGVLTTPSTVGRFRKRLAPPSEWEWHTVPLKTIFRYNYNNVPVEVVTFLGDDAAEYAAQWLNRYHVDVRSVESMDFEMFCESLRWRVYDVRAVVDNDEERIVRYGQKGYLVQLGGEF